MSHKSATALAAEWDALAPVRFRQISSGEDITYACFLVPMILEQLSHASGDAVLDAGCGVGVLTNIISKNGASVVGIDPSDASIQIARQHFGGSAVFSSQSMELYAAENPSSADTVVANMVLMDVLDLSTFVRAANRVLRPGGHFIFSLTHPCFWPTYCGYASERWFHYEREQIIEAPFKITKEQDCPLYSTHIHRPLSLYIQTLEEIGFKLEFIREPLPSAELNARYPNPWTYPRYLFARYRKIIDRGA